MTRSRRTAALLLGSLCALGAASCSAGEGPEVDRPAQSEPAPAALPMALEAAWIVEPSEIQIGDIATLELVIAVPPGQRALPYVPPEVPGLSILSSELAAPRVRPEGTRFRTRIRVRPNGVGVVDWPASRVRVETADGQHRAVEVPGLRLEVQALLSETALTAAERPPHGLIAPAQANPIGFGKQALVAAFAAGALASLAVMLGIQRRRGQRSKRVAPSEDAPPAWAAQLDELREAQAGCERDPLQSATHAADALRRYVWIRYASDIRPLATPEVAEFEAPFAGRSRWPRLIDALEALDGVRFPRPAASFDERARAARAAIARAEAFVSDTQPRLHGNPSQRERASQPEEPVA